MRREKREESDHHQWEKRQADMLHCKKHALLLATEQLELQGNTEDYNDIIYILYT